MLKSFAKTFAQNILVITFAMDNHYTLHGPLDQQSCINLSKYNHYNIYNYIYIYIKNISVYIYMYMYLFIYIYVTGRKRLVASVPGIQVCDVGESINTVSFKLAAIWNNWNI